MPEPAWSYREIRAGEVLTPIELDALALVGWQLVAITRDGGLVVHVFRRPRPSAEEDPS